MAIIGDSPIAAEASIVESSPAARHGALLLAPAIPPKGSHEPGSPHGLVASEGVGMKVIVIHLIAEQGDENGDEDDDLQPKDQPAKKNHPAISLLARDFSCFLPVDPERDPHAGTWGMSFAVTQAVRANG